MPRTYTRKTNRQNWAVEAMAMALRDVEKGTPYKTAARTHGVPVMALKRRAKGTNKSATGSEKTLGGKRPVFTKDQERQLVAHLNEIETKVHGLTIKDVMDLAFQMAEHNGLEHPFSKDKQMAGYEWLRGFRRRNPDITLYDPRATSRRRDPGDHITPREGIFFLQGKHTSNLKNHLAIKHAKLYNEVVNTNRQLNQERNLANNKVKQVETSSKTNIVKIYCVQLITVHGHPPSLLNDEAFQNILKLASPSEEITLKDVLATIPNVANGLKLKIAAEIRNKLISLKLDTVSFKDRKFLAINIQYIKENKVILRTLSVSEVHENLTGDYLNELNVLNDFMIEKEQIYSITMDDDNNMEKILKSDEDELTNEESEVHENEDENEQAETMSDVEEQNSHLHNAIFDNLLNNDNENKFIWCLAKTLQLVINYAIDENVQSTIELARKIVKVLHKAPIRHMLNQANLKPPIVDYPNKWTSTYKMLIRLFMFKEFCEETKEISRLLPPTFWSDIDDLISCLSPFNECILTLQNEQLTIGDFYVTWMKCKSKIDSLRNYFALNLQNAIENREKALLDTDIVLEALYVDGRLNVVLSDEQCLKARFLLNKTWKRIQELQEISKTIPDSDDEFISSLVDPLQPGPSNLEANNSTNKDLSLIEEMLIKTEKSRGLSVRANSFEASMLELRNAPRLPLSTDIIQHWGNKFAHNADMAMVAQAVLAAPATQISIIEMLSSLKFMLCRSRRDLSQNLLQNMILIRSNNDLLE